MMETRRSGRFRHVHAEVDAIDYHLQHGGDNAAAARAAGHQPGFAILRHNGRRHGRERTLGGLHRVSFTANQTVDVWRARLGGKVIHFIVHQDAAVARHDAAAKVGVQRIGHRYRIAFAVDHRKMGGLIAFIRCQLARLDLAGRARFCQVDLLRQRFRIGFAGQRLHRHLNKIGIAKVFRAIGIGIFLRLGDHLNGIGAAEAHFRQIEIFKDIQNLHDVYTAR